MPRIYVADLPAHLNAVGGETRGGSIYHAYDAFLSLLLNDWSVRTDDAEEVGQDTNQLDFGGAVASKRYISQV